MAAPAAWANPPRDPGVRAPGCGDFPLRERREMRQALIEAGALSPRSGAEEGPSQDLDSMIGTFNYPVILIEFSDRSLTATDADITNVFFTPGGGAHGSVRDFYDENSYGQFNFSGDVVATVTLGNTAATYAYNSSLPARGAVTAAVTRALGDPSIDWSIYDNDGDGDVDGLIVVHAGRGAETNATDAIWSHRWSISTVNATNPDGSTTSISNYMIVPEQQTSGGDEEEIVGVVAHELGHVLGLPDLYDTEEDGEGLGNWSLMAGGSWGGDGGTPERPSHMDPWSKFQLGWITPTEIQSSGTISLDLAEEDPDSFYVLWDSGDYSGEEYYLIENRSHTGFDRDLPGEGLVIYHVDEGVLDDGWSIGEVNVSDGNPNGIRIVESDAASGAFNDGDLYAGNNRGDQDDVWSSGTSDHFGVGTTPDAQDNSGDLLSCGVRDISAGGDVIDAYFYLDSDDEDPITQALLTFTPFNWNMGLTPTWLMINGHPLPVETRYGDDVQQVVDVTPYVYTLRHAVVSTWEGTDSHWYMEDIDLADVDGEGALSFETDSGPGDVGRRSHGGDTLGDAPFITWLPEEEEPAEVSLSLELFNIADPGEVWVLVNGSPVHFSVSSWSTGTETLDLDVTAYATSAADNRITVVADAALDGWVRNVSMTDDSGTVDYEAASAGAWDTGTWSHFGHTSAAPDLPFATFIDPTQDREVTLEFEAYDFDADFSGILVVNGGWVRLEDQLYANGEIVSVDLTGFVDNPKRALVSWLTYDDSAFYVEAPVLVDEETLFERVYTAEALSGDIDDAALVGPVPAGGFKGRTWFCEGCNRSSMQIVTQRIPLDKNDSDTVTLQWPDDATDCVPLVTWEKIIEHGDDQCDTHSQVTSGIRQEIFEVEVEHCGYGHYDSDEAARARATLLCFADEGYAVYDEIDTDADSSTPSSTSFSLPSEPAYQMAAFCSLTEMDGNGDIDSEGSCRASLSGTAVSGDISRSCNHDNKEYGVASVYGVGFPADVSVHIEAFTARDSWQDVTYEYDDTWDDHLAFVVPTRVDTNCKDHGSFESECHLDDEAGEVTCEVIAYGSITGYEGYVMFIDGDFPEAGSTP